MKTIESPSLTVNKIVCGIRESDLVGVHLLHWPTIGIFLGVVGYSYARARVRHELHFDLRWQCWMATCDSTSRKQCYEWMDRAKVYHING
jgi:hypothetical protein